MRKITIFFLITAIIFSFIACANTSSVSSNKEITTTPTSSNSSNSSSSKKTNDSNYSSSKKSNDNYYSSNTSFTNKYGTPTTKCAHSGCNNYIASSGDTNCCATHSKRCLECNCYIDEDALYCISCLKKAVDSVSTGGSYSSQHECYVCGTMSSSCEKIGSFWYCPSCAQLMHALGY